MGNLQADKLAANPHHLLALVHHVGQLHLLPSSTEEKQAERATVKRVFEGSGILLLSLQFSWADNFFGHILVHDKVWSKKEDVAVALLVGPPAQAK